MSQLDIRGFLQNLDRSRLLGEESAAELWRRAGSEADAQAFADRLVEQGTLTPYQAEKLLRGSTRFFLDDYKLTDMIGTGRMAGVYRAVHKLGMPVAVKILPPSSAKKTEVLARFRREAELALQLDHRHVVKTFHAGVSDGLHYIAMELLEGQTLEECLKERGKLPPGEVLRLADQTLQALDHLHHKGMVHRDVKPGNLMLASLPGASAGETLFAVKLLDVGLGRALFSEENQPGGEEPTAAGQTIGTPDYTAPEQSRDSRAADIRSDLYGLGCVLYECLMGRVPFPDKNLVNKLIQHAKAVPPALDLSGHPKTDHLQAWLWKLLAKNPDDRFQTPAEAIAAALHPTHTAKPTSSSKVTLTTADKVAAVDPARKAAFLVDASDRTTPISPRRPPWKYIAIGSGAVFFLIFLSYLFISALTGPSKPKTSKDQNKEVAAVSSTVEETRLKSKETKKDAVVPVKKTEPEPKDPPKKTEPESKDPPKKTEPEPKDPPKKTEPEPKDPPKKTEPEPKDPPKEMKKEPMVVVTPPDDRTPVPSADEISTAEVQVREVLKGDYAKTKTADRLALAAKLLDESAGTKDNAVRYVMLRDARNFAAGAGNAALAMTVAQEIAADFQVSAGKANAAAAELLAAANLTPATASECTDAIFGALDAARVADDWTSATALARAAETAARKSQSALLSAMAQTKLREAETMKAEADKVKDHIAALKSNPDDPDANLAVGRFHALIKQDWEAGIELLAKGSNAPLKQAAEIDMKAGNGSETDRAAAGDSWFELARTADPTGKFAMQSRAHFWYTGALAGLTGLDKVKIEKRLADLQAVLDARAGGMKRWIANRQAITDGMIKKWDFVGGTAAMKEFELIPKDGAILIGFSCSITNNEDPPEGLQPIFLSPRGEVKGTAYGGSKSTDVLKVTKAKPGYAIGALYVRANAQSRLLAFKPIYMKIADKGLDPTKRYVGAQVGEVGDAQLLGGDGNFIIGIRGKITLDNKVGTLSIITLTTQEPAPAQPDPKTKLPPK